MFLSAYGFIFALFERNKLYHPPAKKKLTVSHTDCHALIRKVVFGGSSIYLFNEYRYIWNKTYIYTYTNKYDIYICYFWDLPLFSAAKRMLSLQIHLIQNIKFFRAPRSQAVSILGSFKWNAGGFAFCPGECWSFYWPSINNLQIAKESQ